MSTGDSAGAKGLKTYTDALLVKDVDEALNQRGDDIAETMTRLDTVEAAAVGVPKFAVQRSTNGQAIVHNAWTMAAASAFSGPLLNTGFTSWTAGAVTVARPGVYQIAAHYQPYGRAYTSIALQVIKNYVNGADIDSAKTIAKDEWASGQAGDATRSASASAFGLTRLAAGDALRLFVLQRNVDGATMPNGDNPADFTFSAVWIDS